MGPRVAHLGLVLRPIYWLELHPSAGLRNLHTCPLHSKRYLWGCLGFQSLVLHEIFLPSRTPADNPLGCPFSGWSFSCFFFTKEAALRGPPSMGLSKTSTPLSQPPQIKSFFWAWITLGSHDLLLWPYILLSFLLPWNFSLFQACPGISTNSRCFCHA